jgi:hypothetical protein
MSFTLLDNINVKANKKIQMVFVAFNGFLLLCCVVIQIYIKVMLTSHNHIAQRRREACAGSLSPSINS